MFTVNNNNYFDIAGKFCPLLSHGRLFGPSKSINSSHPPWAQNWCGWALVMVINVCNFWWKRLSKLLAKKEAVYFYIVLLITKCVRVGIKGNEKLLLDLGWPLRHISHVNGYRIDPLQLPCHFRKTLWYFIQVHILAAILEYMGIGKMH